MKRTLIALATIVVCLDGPRASQPAGQSASLQSLARAALSQIDGTLRVPGLKADVQVLRDDVALGEKQIVG